MPRHLRGHPMPASGRPPRHAPFGVIGWVALALAALAAMGGAGWVAHRRAGALLRAELLQDARVVAAMVSEEHLAALSGSEADLATPDYRRLKRQLTHAREAGPRYRFLYLLGRRPDGRVFFYLDSEPASSPDCSPPGQIYSEAPSAVTDAFASGREAAGVPYADRWGSWLSAFVPVRATGPGRGRVVLGMDISASEWRWNVAARAALPAAWMSVAILLALLTLGLLQVNRGIRAHEAALGLQSLVAGQIQDGVMLTDLAGEVTYANEAAAALLRCSPGPLQDQGIYALDGGPEGRTHQGKIIQWTQEDGQWRGEVVRLAANGSQAVLDCRTRLVRDASGVPVALCWAFTDISERKRMEDALRESEAKFRTAFHTNPDAIAINRLSDGLYLEANEGFLRGLGYERSDVMGRTSVDLDIWANPEHRGRLVAALRSEGCIENLEADFCRKDGTVVHGLMSARTIRLGDDLCILSITRDMTAHRRADEEREQLQAQLLQAQKMESVGRLAGGVAHDYNNMLAVILGHAELALPKSESAPAVRGHLLEIRKAAQRSADLTRQLLAFARRQAVSPRVLDLNETVAGTVRMLHRLIGEDIELVWSPGAGLWPVEMDPTQIGQILANLAVNARDAISGVGKVTVATENVSLDAAFCSAHGGGTPGDYVLVSVSDTGCGMDGETLEHLFEPFFTTKEVGKGTGLGLSTVYGAVTQNRGCVDVRSAPGQGTTVCIFLPRAAGEVEVADTGAAPEVGRGTGTVLLVEDEPAILRLARDILTLRGYTVLAAGSPVEALAVAREHAGPIHLLVTDVVMPKMSGKDLKDQLCALRPGLRVLFMSGYTQDIIAEQGIIDGDVHFLGKPFTTDALAAKVREALEHVDAPPRAT